MQPYPVSVAEILAEHSASIHVEGDVDLGDFTIGDQSFTGLAPSHFAVHLTNTGSGIVAVGDIASEIDARCTRCLCDFPLLVTGEVEAFYVEDRYRDEIPEETEAESIHPDGTIDLAPALMSAIAVEIPFAPVHDPECAGLCPVCGANLNEGPCGCHETETAPHPFDVLRSLLPPDGSGADGSSEG